MTKSPKTDSWKPTPRKDPIKPGMRDDLGGSYSISSKIDRAQASDAARSGKRIKGGC